MHPRAASQAPRAPPASYSQLHRHRRKSRPHRRTNVFGGVDTKKYIIETTGTGVAIFDYDNDGWPDIFLVNGTTLEGISRRTSARPTISTTTITTAPSPTSPQKPASPQPAGARASASATTTTTAGKISTSPTTARTASITTSNGVFTEVAEKAGVAGSGKAWGTGCAFVDYDRDGQLDLDRRQLRRLRSRHRARARRAPVLHLERRSRDVRPARPAWREEHPLPQSRRRHLRRRHHQSPHRSDRRPLLPSASPRSTTTTTAGPTFSSPATARPAFSITTIATALSPTSPSPPAPPSTKTAASRPAWARPSPTTTATATSTSSKPISPTTPPLSTATTATAPSPTSPSPPASASNTQVSRLGHHVLRLRQRRLARPDSGERPRLSRGRQPALGSTLQRAAHPLSQQWRRHVHRHLRLRRTRHHHRSIVARPGRRRSVERWPHVRGHQQHERAAQPAGESECKNANHWIAVHTVGTKSNRDGIGARIR